jgi:hypothetical protein
MTQQIGQSLKKEFYIEAVAREIYNGLPSDLNE